MDVRSKAIVLLMVLVPILVPTAAYAEYHPQLGRFLQRDPFESGLPIINEGTFHGRPPVVHVRQFNPPLHYVNGPNIYQYVGSNPPNRLDPLGNFTLIELAFTSGETAELRAQDMARTGLAAALLTAMLGAMMTDMQWGVGGGMSASGFDAFLQGVDATMSGACALGESLMVAGEAAVIAVFMTQALAISKAKSLENVIRLHFGKIATGGGGDWGTGPDKWKSDIDGFLRQVESLTKHMGKKTAEKFGQWIQQTRSALEQALKGGGNMPPPMPG